MSAPQVVKSNLSKGLLQMQFMKRSKDARQREDDAAKARELQDRFLPCTSVGRRNYMFESSYAVLEDLMYNRFSFNGFNPEVEKVMEYYKALKEGRDLDKLDIDASAEADADVPADAVSETLGRKMKRKRDRKPRPDESEDSGFSEPPLKQREFLKPE